MGILERLRTGLRALAATPSRRAPPASTTAITLRNPWRAVGIAPGSGGCAPSQELGSRRFLCHEAPLLPLPQCTRPGGCQCRYRHFDDRRQRSRRAADALRSGEIRSYVDYRQRERRRQPDRRSADS